MPLHGLNHRRLTRLPPREVKTYLADFAAAACGRNEHFAALAAPPYGSQNLRTYLTGAESGSTSWSGPPTAKTGCAHRKPRSRHERSRVQRPGGIILVHDPLAATPTSRHRRPIWTAPRSPTDARRSRSSRNTGRHCVAASRGTPPSYDGLVQTLMSEQNRPGGSPIASMLLWAQRRSWPVPHRVRTIAKRSFERAGRRSIPGEALVDDWSRPLLRRPNPQPDDTPVQGAPIEQLPSRSVGSPREHRHNTAETALSCVVATDALDTGGLDEVVAFLARRLPDFGIETTVVRTGSARGYGDHPDGRLAAALRNEGIHVVDLSARDVPRWFTANPPDVISAHVPAHWLLEEATDQRIPVVETLHGLPTPIGTDWAHEPDRSRGITAFVAVSDLVRRQYLAGNTAFPHRAVVTVPNSFSETHRQYADRVAARTWLGLESEFLFVSLARHSLQKNTFGLVSAFSEAARVRPQAHLLIAGRIDDPTYVQQVRRLLKGNSSAAQVHLRDNTSEVAAVLAAADAFVLDSFFEGWSVASMEALAAGLPLVMSEVGGAHEQIGEGGECGYLVANPLGDAEGATWERAARVRFRRQVNERTLTSALIRVIDERESWAQRREQLPRTAVERFSADACAQRHAMVLGHAAVSKTTQRFAASLPFEPSWVP